jgi:hypothetical protein
LPDKVRAGGIEGISAKLEVFKFNSYFLVEKADFKVGVKFPIRTIRTSPNLAVNGKRERPTHRSNGNIMYLDCDRHCWVKTKRRDMCPVKPVVAGNESIMLATVSRTFIQTDHLKALRALIIVDEIKYPISRNVGFES